MLRAIQGRSAVCSTSSLATLRSHMGGKQLPEDWTEGVIVKIPKKGALSYCNKWRGISQLSVPSKILAKIIIQRASSSAQNCRDSCTLTFYISKKPLIASTKIVFRYPQGLRDPTADCPCHPELLRQLHMQVGKQQVQV